MSKIGTAGLDQLGPSPSKSRRQPDIVGHEMGASRAGRKHTLQARVNMSRNSREVRITLPTTSLDAAIDDVVERFPRTLDYLAKG
jgi:hypothetical protein